MANAWIFVWSLVILLWQCSGWCSSSWQNVYCSTEIMSVFTIVCLPVIFISFKIKVYDTRFRTSETFRRALGSCDRASWAKCEERERKPTRCNNYIFIINFCFNMFRASLCPSSGEQRPYYCITFEGLQLQ